MNKLLKWSLTVGCCAVLLLCLSLFAPIKSEHETSEPAHPTIENERLSLMDTASPSTAAGPDLPNLSASSGSSEQQPDYKTELSVVPFGPNRPNPIEDAQIHELGKVAYLTFDDGPSRSTPRILNILKDYGIKATFFVIGKTSEESIQQLKSIVNQGHVLGNHTFTHDYKKIYKSAEAFKADVDRLDHFLEQNVGVRPEVLRYPGGSNNQLSWRAGGRNVMKTITREMSKNGNVHFDWNVSSTDAAAPVQDKQSIIDSVISNSKGKAKIIVLMHDMDLKTTTVEALPAIITHLKSQGYRFDVLSKSSFTYQFLKP